ncbi:hypothetical protein [Cyanobium sp. NIES-981]|uniref:hypothetical protein n=1 Tax=Cyanobium sp. NIES-981 TaxID=1851505 RepID=UPI0007DDB716|nr:hypothetical protein [Cyanobium sp. NIES-981]SBO42788.1 conserved protein of unknown function [Cyanobium sp. NIES-981]
MPERSIPLDEQGFRRIGDACGTDKTLHHGYQRFYPQFLAPLRRRRRLAIVEIGYGEGKSIPLWRALFPQAQVICLDRDVSASGEGYDVFQVDQSDPEAVKAVIERIDQPVHLIVDDGSHVPAHQLSCFSILFEHLLVPGGIYIVEDVETSYWTNGDVYGYPTRFGLYTPWSAVEALKLAVDYLNRSCLAPQDRTLVEHSLAMAGLSPTAVGLISMLSFAQNCAIATRMLPEHLAFFERPYLYPALTARE